jgi:tetratricopeptide (TPR) repeat protein
MDDYDQQEQIQKNLMDMATEELLDIWQNGDEEDWNEGVFEIIEEILLERLDALPTRSIVMQTSQTFDRIEGYLENNEFDKALSECEAAIQLDPESAVAYNYRGEIHDEMGQIENAIVDYQKAIQLDPELKSAWEGLLSVEPELEDAFEESAAKQHLDRALEHANDGEFEEALAECETAKPLMPNLAIAHNYLGLIFQTLDQLEPAIDSYLKAVQLNPRFYAARENLANARVRWEEEQYLLFSSLPPGEVQEVPMEVDESQLPESHEPLPQWLYMDEKSFLLVGWAGHRTRQGRSGYDPLENDFEYAHVQGMIIRSLLASKFRTRDPLSLIFNTFVGVLYFLGGLSPFVFGGGYGVVAGILYSPYLIVGALLLKNVYLSLQFDELNQYEDGGYTFF